MCVLLPHNTPGTTKNVYDVTVTTWKGDNIKTGFKSVDTDIVEWTELAHLIGAAGVCAKILRQTDCIITIVISYINFLFCMFNDAVTSPHYTPRLYRGKIRTILKGRGRKSPWLDLCFCPGACPDGHRRTRFIFNKESRSVGRSLNPGTAVYEAGPPVVGPRLSGVTNTTTSSSAATLLKQIATATAPVPRGLLILLDDGSDVVHTLCNLHWT